MKHLRLFESDSNAEDEILEYIKSFFTGIFDDVKEDIY